MAILTENIYTDITALTVSLLVVIIVYVKWSFTYWDSRDVQTLPVDLFFGNAKDLLCQKVPFGIHIKSVYDAFKNKGLKYCGYYFLTKPQLIVFDLDLIKSIMLKDFNHFTDRGGYVNEEVDPLSGHLFSLKGSKWKNLRTKLTPTFTSGKMKMMFEILVQCSDGLVVVTDEMVKKGQDIDIKDLVGRFTTDVIGSCAFGIECNSLKNPDSEFRKHGKRIFEGTTFETVREVVGDFVPGLLSFFRQPVNKSDVTKFFMGMAKETVEYREKNNIVRKDFMHLLIQLKNNVTLKDEESVGQLGNENVSESEAGKSLTIAELAAQAFVFFLAGFETSSTTLTFCFYELVSNEEIQDKVREEINTVLENHNGKISYNAIMEMTYMEKCIQETLRKYPPVSDLTRDCTEEYKIPNTNLKLEKGVRVIIPIQSIQNDPKYYPDPDKFDPERFSTESKAQRHPYAWLPFGEGPRACIGLRFGMMQTKLALAVLLKNFTFTLSPKTITPMVMDPKCFVPTVSGGIWLNAEKIL